MRVTLTLSEKSLKKHEKEMRNEAIADFGEEETKKDGFLVSDNHLYGVDVDCSGGEITLFVELPVGWITVIITAEQFETIAKGIRSHVTELDKALRGEK